jgi:translation initiation factor IF-3
MLINEAISSNTLRVLSNENEFLGVFDKNDAIKLAKSQNKDLICINENDEVPVCKIADYGRYLYDEKKRLKEQKGTKVELKEIQIRPNTDVHDLGIKAKKIHKFFELNNRVKIVMTLRGRENNNLSVAQNTFDKFLELIGRFAVEKEMTTTNNIISIQIKGV